MAALPPFDAVATATLEPPPPPEEPGEEMVDFPAVADEPPLPPPPEEPDGETGHSPDDVRASEPNVDNLADVTTRRLRRLLGSYDGEQAGKLLDWLNEVEASGLITTSFGRQTRTWDLIISALRMSYTQSRQSIVKLEGDIVFARASSDKARAELSACVQAAREEPVDDRHALWLLSSEDVSVARARTKLSDAITALDQRGEITDAELAKVFEDATGAHPLARSSDTSSSSPSIVRGDRAAERIAARKAAGRDIRLSSGFPMLDYALTRFHKGEMRGIISRGEYGVIYSGSGVGKSALFRVMIRNIIVDLVERHGMPYTAVLLAFTEEDEDTILDAMEMLPGQRFHRYARNLVLAPVNGDLEALHRAFCQTVAEQVRIANRLGLPLDEVLPPLVAVDYISAVAQNLPNPMTSGLERVTNYLMRGIRSLDRKMMEHYGGAPYSTLTGDEWDPRLDSTELKSSVIAVSQIKKDAEETPVYRPGAPMDQYAKTSADGGPILEPRVTPEGGLTYEAWQPKPGDQPILEAEAMIGTSQVKKDVWWAIQLHRSRPDLNPVDAQLPDGQKVRRLEDTRARLYLAKTRYSANLEVVPMAFDSGPNGFGMWFDVLSVDLWNRGSYEPYVPDSLGEWQAGDPMLPWPNRLDLFDVAY